MVSHSHSQRQRLTRRRRVLRNGLLLVSGSASSIGSVSASSNASSLYFPPLQSPEILLSLQQQTTSTSNEPLPPEYRTDWSPAPPYHASLDSQPIHPTSPTRSQAPSQSTSSTLVGSTPSSSDSPPSALNQGQRSLGPSPSSFVASNVGLRSLRGTGILPARSLSALSMIHLVQFSPKERLSVGGGVIDEEKAEGEGDDEQDGNEEKGVSNDKPGRPFSPSTLPPNVQEQPTQPQRQQNSHGVFIQEVENAFNPVQSPNFATILGSISGNLINPRASAATSQDSLPSLSGYRVPFESHQDFDRILSQLHLLDQDARDIFPSGPASTQGSQDSCTYGAFAATHTGIQAQREDSSELQLPQGPVLGYVTLPSSGLPSPSRSQMTAEPSSSPSSAIEATAIANDEEEERLRVGEDDGSEDNKKVQLRLVSSIDICGQASMSQPGFEEGEGGGIGRDASSLAVPCSSLSSLEAPSAARSRECVLDAGSTAQLSPVEVEVDTLDPYTPPPARRFRIPGKVPPPIRVSHACQGMERERLTITPSTAYGSEVTNSSPASGTTITPVRFAAGYWGWVDTELEPGLVEAPETQPVIYSPVPQTPTRSNSDTSGSGSGNGQESGEEVLRGMKVQERRVTRLGVKLDLDTMQVSPADSTPKPGRKARNGVVACPDLERVDEEGVWDTPTKVRVRDGERVRMLGEEESAVVEGERGGPDGEVVARETTRPPVLRFGPPPCGILNPTPEVRVTNPALPGWKFDPFAPTPQASLEEVQPAAMVACPADEAGPSVPRMVRSGHQQVEAPVQGQGGTNAMGVVKQVSVGTYARNGWMNFIKEQEDKRVKREQVPQFADRIVQSPKPMGDPLYQDPVIVHAEPYPSHPAEDPAPSYIPTPPDQWQERSNFTNMLQWSAGRPAGLAGPLPQTIQQLSPETNAHPHYNQPPQTLGTTATNSRPMGFGRQAFAAHSPAVQLTQWAYSQHLSPFPGPNSLNVPQQPGFVPLPQSGYVPQNNAPASHSQEDQMLLPNGHLEPAADPSSSNPPAYAPPAQQSADTQAVPPSSQRHPSRRRFQSNSAQFREMKALAMGTMLYTFQPHYQVWLLGFNRFWEVLCTVYGIRYRYDDWEDDRRNPQLPPVLLPDPISPRSIRSPTAQDLADHERYFRHCLFDLVSEIMNGTSDTSGQAPLARLIGFEWARSDAGIPFSQWMSNSDHWRVLWRNLQDDPDGALIPPIWRLGANSEERGFASQRWMWSEKEREGVMQGAFIRMEEVDQAARRMMEVDRLRQAQVADRGVQVPESGHVSSDVAGTRMNDFRVLERDSQSIGSITSHDPHDDLNDWQRRVLAHLRRWFDTTHWQRAEVEAILQKPAHPWDMHGSEYHQAVQWYIDIIPEGNEELETIFDHLTLLGFNAPEDWGKHLEAGRAMWGHLMDVMMTRPSGKELERVIHETGKQRIEVLESMAQVANQLSTELYENWTRPATPRITNVNLPATASFNPESAYAQLPNHTSRAYSGLLLPQTTSARQNSTVGSPSSAPLHHPDMRQVIQTWLDHLSDAHKSLRRMGNPAIQPNDEELYTFVDSLLPPIKSISVSMRRWLNAYEPSADNHYYRTSVKAWRRFAFRLNKRCLKLEAEESFHRFEHFKLSIQSFMSSQLNDLTEQQSKALKLLEYVTALQSQQKQASTDTNVSVDASPAVPPDESSSKQFTQPALAPEPSAPRLLGSSSPSDCNLPEPDPKDIGAAPRDPDEQCAPPYQWSSMVVNVDHPCQRARCSAVAVSIEDEDCLWTPGFVPCWGIA